MLLSLLLVSLGTVSRAGANIPVPGSKPAQTDITGYEIATSPAPLPGRKPARAEAIPAKSELKLPTGPLSRKNADLYQRIFAAQAAAQMDEADPLIAQLTDHRLLGHVLYQRYMHPTAYRSSFEELYGWMRKYNDHPGADRVYRLAVARAPGGQSNNIPRPNTSRGVVGYLGVLSDRGQTYTPQTSRTATQEQAVRGLRTKIRRDISRGNPSAALRHLEKDEAAKWLDTVEYDMLRGDVAHSFMLTGKLKTARQLGVASARRSGIHVPGAAWAAGLSAWRLKDYKLAADMFELSASSPYASAWTISGSAYWASRAHMRTGNIKAVNAALKKAAAYPRTFYGLIATRSLGWDFDFNWTVPEFRKAHANRLSQYPAFARVELLVAAGQYHLAEAELRQINPGTDRDLREALIAYASHAGLPAYAMRLAEAYAHPDGGLYDAALYPLSPWKPEGGYTIDRALILALIRQESRFDPEAQNPSGATGLMQLMPTTASFVSGERLYRNRDGRHALKDPRVNMEIGQTYVEQLLGNNVIESDLMSLLIAYNAGPGNLRRWKRQLEDTLDDPLLFIESIPMSETRAFVERVMSNYWIYRQRLDQPSQSLDEVAAGGWAIYNSLDRAGPSQTTAAATNVR